MGETERENRTKHIILSQFGTTNELKKCVKEVCVWAVFSGFPSFVLPDLSVWILIEASGVNVKSVQVWNNPLSH